MSRGCFNVCVWKLCYVDHLWVCFSSLFFIWILVTSCLLVCLVTKHCMWNLLRDSVCCYIPPKRMCICFYQAARLGALGTPTHLSPVRNGGHLMLDFSFSENWSISSSLLFLRIAFLGPNWLSEVFTKITSSWQTMTSNFWSPTSMNLSKAFSDCNHPATDSGISNHF